MNNTQQEEAERLARAFVDNHPYPYSASPRLYLNKGFVKGYLSALPKAEVVEKMREALEECAEFLAHGPSDREAAPLHEKITQALTIKS